MDLQLGLPGFPGYLRFGCYARQARRACPGYLRFVVTHVFRAMPAGLAQATCALVLLLKLLV